MLHVFDSLRYIPDLIRIHHQHTSGGSRVLALKRRRVDRLSILGHVVGIIDDRSQKLGPSDIVVQICPDLELEHVETLSERFQSQSANLP